MSKPSTLRSYASPMVLGTVTVTLGSAILALALDSVEVRAGAMRESSVAFPGDRCTRSCVSHVVAGLLPGESARVVSGSAAYGSALDATAALIAVETRSSAGVSIGASARFVGFTDMEPVYGGRVYASWRHQPVTNIVE